MKKLLIFLTIIISVFFFSTISSSVSTDSSTIIPVSQQIHKIKTTTVKTDTIPIKLARRGCCSHHGGVDGCDEASGMIKCNDGTLSPTCTCAEY